LFRPVVGFVMVKKAFLVTSLCMVCAVMAALSIATQPRMDDPQDVAPVSQVDAYDLTLKSRNLPIQTLGDAI
jgi:hypothetical protein